MKKYYLVIFFILKTLSVFAQINPTDSTAQVIGYWEKNEKQSYSIATDKIKLSGSDTTSREIIKYDVDIFIIDSTAESYTIEWFYKNYSIDTDNKLVKKLASMAQDMKVIIKTDEFGAFEEVLNWEEVRDYIKKGINDMKKEFNNQTVLDKILQQIEDTYYTKAAIESAAILDILQFYTFHGAQYKLGELLKMERQLQNLIGPEPFDTQLTVYLDEINIEDDNYVLRASEIVDTQQLTEATWNYLEKLARSAGAPPLKQEELKDLKNETLIASRIHGSGWVIYSVQTKTTSMDDTSEIEERTIELK
jgi:hypothetical protein